MQFDKVDERELEHEILATPDDRFIEHLLDRQERGLRIRCYEHLRAIHLIDKGQLGMVGFRYCKVQEAKEDSKKLRFLL